HPPAQKSCRTLTAMPVGGMSAGGIAEFGGAVIAMPAIVVALFPPRCGAWKNEPPCGKQTVRAASSWRRENPGAPRQRRKLAGKSIALGASDLIGAAAPEEVKELQRAIEKDGGTVLTTYRE